MNLRRTALALSAIVLASIAITGCASTVALEASADAANPSCADVVVRLPDQIDDNVKRETDAQGTGAWGDPATIILHCGVPVPGPTTTRCVTLDSVDWLVDNSDDDVTVFTTYGRDPAVEVVVDNDTSGTNALNALASAVGSYAPVGGCTDPEDFTQGASDAVLPEP